MAANISGEYVNRVGMIMPHEDSRQTNGVYSLLLTVPGDRDYLLENHSSQPLQEWVYERVFVSGWLSGGETPVLTVEQMEMLEDREDDYWNDDEY